MKSKSVILDTLSSLWQWIAIHRIRYSRKRNCANGFRQLVMFTCISSEQKNKKQKYGIQTLIFRLLSLASVANTYCPLALGVNEFMRLKKPKLIPTTSISIIQAILILEFEAVSGCTKECGIDGYGSPRFIDCSPMMDQKPFSRLSSDASVSFAYRPNDAHGENEYIMMVYLE